MAEYETSTMAEAEGPVHQVEWCGNDAILVTWDSLALLVGPFGDTLRYEFLACAAALPHLFLRPGTYIQVQCLR